MSNWELFTTVFWYAVVAVVAFRLGVSISEFVEACCWGVLFWTISE